MFLFGRRIQSPHTFSISRRRNKILVRITGFTCKALWTIYKAVIMFHLQHPETMKDENGFITLSSCSICT
ncbi:hypothetical protein KsCSTR_26620 [Candidatus Kuenenia stuttgartiensis]|uniref:Uncharacterized protein n=1 Tax=Kuenenia stuttgartiensis TaxID=174633 RepID=Q1Q7B8_KUEST|nr:hypothetical protein KsCSTR_26620 [Candidatus Kuenenia stuttgartiensis]CAJ73464.1 unknown protein [Candidatus Kuenenia stuttgartiensis]